MDKVGNTAGKSMYVMKVSDHEVPKTCRCKDEKPSHGNPQLEDISQKSKRREEPFFALLTFPLQSVLKFEGHNLVSTPNC